MPPTLMRLILRVSGHHQVWLALLSIVVFVVDTAPIEVQRRLINDTVKGGDAASVIWLAVLYGLLALLLGLLKMGLNVYRGWVSETVVKWLRHEITRLVEAANPKEAQDEAVGSEISMVIAEADPIGGFVGSSISEPLLQGGIILIVFGYLVYLQPPMALVGLIVFVPQLFLVPLVQGAINRRVGERIWELRRISVSIVRKIDTGAKATWAKDSMFDHVFELNMGIYRLKFGLNFVMNLLSASGTALILGLGGYFVIRGETEIGTVVAFVSGLSKINDPWGDLVSWYRDFRVTQERYALIVRTLDTNSPGLSGLSPKPPVVER